MEEFWLALVCFCIGFGFGFDAAVWLGKAK